VLLSTFANLAKSFGEGTTVDILFAADSTTLLRLSMRLKWPGAICCITTSLGHYKINSKTVSQLAAYMLKKIVLRQKIDRLG
jgi:hypothetical protein